MAIYHFNQKLLSHQEWIHMKYLPGTNVKDPSIEPVKDVRGVQLS